jgi:hypothetical protein
MRGLPACDLVTFATGTPVPLADKRHAPTTRPASATQAAVMPDGLRRRALSKKPVRPDAELEAALLREYLRCNSVAALARALAIRIDDGTSAEQFIAAAEGGAATPSPRIRAGRGKWKPA